MNTIKHENHGAVAGQVDCNVRPGAEREAFEAWCDEKWGNCAYLHKSGTCGEWTAWQAARADLPVLKAQVDSLRTALQRVLDARNKEAKAAMSYQNARENFSDSTDERKAHERAMLAASEAELQARTLLLTLRA
jgi:hypothetical protein